MELLTLLNVFERFDPKLPIATIAATAIKAAIRPYSIAVAPSSVFNSFLIMFILVSNLFIQTPSGFLKTTAKMVLYFYIYQIVNVQMIKSWFSSNYTLFLTRARVGLNFPGSRSMTVKFNSRAGESILQCLLHIAPQPLSAQNSQHVCKHSGSL